MRRSEFRAVYYDHDGKPHVIRPTNAADDTEDGMAFQLEHFVESGYATGGHLETFVTGIGWVVCDEETVGSDQVVHARL